MHYDVAYGELDQVPGAVATSVAASLQVDLTAGEADAIGVRSTEDVRAYEFYLRGVGLIASNHEPDVEVGLGLLRHAVALDARLADAHAYIGYALWRKYFCCWDAGADVLQRALESTDRALALNSSSPVGHMARIRMFWDLGRHEEALVEGHDVYVRAPEDTDAMLALARAYTNAGMADRALPLTERVLALNSSNLTARKLLIWDQLMAGDHEAAVETGAAYLAIHPEDANTAWAVAMAHIHLGQLDSATVTAELGLTADRFDFTLWVLLGYIHRLRGNDSVSRQVCVRGAEAVTSRIGASSSNYRAMAWLANLQAAAGAGDAAMASVARVRKADPGNAYLLYRTSHVLAELGRTDEASECLDRAISGGFLSQQMLRHEEVCALGKLVGDVRYESAVRGLEERVDALRRRYVVPV